jgi:mannosyltransferase
MTSREQNGQDLGDPAFIAGGRAALPPDRLARIGIGLIIVLALALRLYQLGEESLWNDEVVSIGSAENIRGLARSRPLYFVMLRVWMLFGHSDAWLRGLAVVFGVLSVWILYRLGQRLGGESLGLIAALILALSPLFIDLSQEIRFYTLSTLLGLAGTLALARGIAGTEARATGIKETGRQGEPRQIQNPKSKLHTPLYWWAASRYLMILTTPLNVLMLLPDLLLLWLAYRDQRPVLKMCGRLLAAMFVLWLPFAFLAARQAPSFVAGWVQIVPRPGLWAVINKLMSFTAWWPTDYTETDPRFPSGSVMWFYHGYIAVLAVLIVAALAGRSHSSRNAWLAVWGFLPLAAVFIISRVSSSLWLDRYLSFAAPYVLLLLAVGFLRVWQANRPAGMVVALLYATAVGSALVRFYTVQDRTDWRGAAHAIRIQQQPGDAVRLYPSYAGAMLGHYYHGPMSIDPVDGLPDNVFLVQPMLEEAFRKLPPIRSRLWLVYWRFGKEEQHATFGSVVAERFQVLQRQEFKDLDVFLLAPRTGGQ